MCPQLTITPLQTFFLLKHTRLYTKMEEKFTSLMEISAEIKCTDSLTII